MTDTPRQDLADHPLRVRDFYLGRQPVLDRNQALFGYELLFRSTPLGPANIGQGGEPGEAAPAPGLGATAAVIAHAAQLGLARAIGDAHCFLNVDTDVLGSDIFAFLPRERTVLELAASVLPTDAVLARLAELAGHGFQFALDGVGGASANDAERLQKLLPLARFVKLDLRHTSQPALAALVARLHGMHKTVVADKVETREEYQACLELGIDYFQGYYFARPSVLGGRKLSPSQLAVLELMKLVTSDVDNADIERAVKRDVTVAMNLLRLVNTPAVGARFRINSVGHALIVLGRQQLQRWLQILLYVKGHQYDSPLLQLATTRGKTMENLLEHLYPGERTSADIGFTVGIMSLMDTLFSVAMPEILDSVNVLDDVRAALLHRTGNYGDVLTLIELVEQAREGPELTGLLHRMGLPPSTLYASQLAAYDWINEYASGVTVTPVR
jgi:EAL and modified HD-GYP domain-containing signal transduction protein